MGSRGALSAFALILFGKRQPRICLRENTDGLLWSKTSHDGCDLTGASQTGRLDRLAFRRRIQQSRPLSRADCAAMRGATILKKPSLEAGLADRMSDSPESPLLRLPSKLALDLTEMFASFFPRPRMFPLSATIEPE